MLQVECACEQFSNPFRGASALCRAVRRASEGEPEMPAGPAALAARRAGGPRKRLLPQLRRDRSHRFRDGIEGWRAMIARIRHLAAPEAGCGHPNSSWNTSDGAADWANDDIRCRAGGIIGRDIIVQLLSQHLAASRQSRGNGPNRTASDLGDFAVA